MVDKEEGRGGEEGARKLCPVVKDVESAAFAHGSNEVVRRVISWTRLMERCKAK